MSELFQRLNYWNRYGSHLLNTLRTFSFLVTVNYYIQCYCDKLCVTNSTYSATVINSECHKQHITNWKCHSLTISMLCWSTKHHHHVAGMQKQKAAVEAHSSLIQSHIKKAIDTEFSLRWCYSAAILSRSLCCADQQNIIVTLKSF